MNNLDILNRYQVVVLKTPYNLFEDKESQDFFMKMCQLKIKGYLKEYQAGMLPFDSSDFVANHIVLCSKTNEGLAPIMGFKSVSLSTCDFYRINFPMLGMLKSPDDTSKYTAYFENLIQSARLNGTADTLAYNGSFTVHPTLRGDEFFHKRLWDFGFYLFASHYMEEKINKVVAVCSTKFKVDKKKLEHGWSYVSIEGNNIDAFRCTSLHETSFVPMELNNVKLVCQSDKSLFPGLWENRLVLSLETINTRKVA